MSGLAMGLRMHLQAPVAIQLPMASWLKAQPAAAAAVSCACWGVGACRRPRPMATAACRPATELRVNDTLFFQENYSSFQGFSPGRLQDFPVDRGDLQDKDWSNRGTRRIDEREAEKEQHRQLAHLLCLF